MQARGFLLETSGPDPHIGAVLGANFMAGAFAGGVAAAATCPLDVAKTWRQIEVSCCLLHLLTFLCPAACLI